MDVGIAITRDEAAEYIGKLVQDLSNQIEEYFKLKEYGEGLKSLSMGAILLAPPPPGFEHLFKIRKPKYTTQKKTIDFHGIPVTIEMCLEYDVKFDLNAFVGLSDAEIKKLLSEKILDSLSVFEEMKQKIKDFDSNKFRADMERWFHEIYLVK